MLLMLATYNFCKLSFWARFLPLLLLCRPPPKRLLCRPRPKRAHFSRRHDNVYLCTRFGRPGQEQQKQQEQQRRRRQQ